MLVPITKIRIMFCKLHFRGYLPALPFTFANVLKLPINCLSEKMTHSYLLQYLVKGSNSQTSGLQEPSRGKFIPSQQYICWHCQSRATKRVKFVYLCKRRAFCRLWQLLVLRWGHLSSYLHQKIHNFVFVVPLRKRLKCSCVNLQKLRQLIGGVQISPFFSASKISIFSAF